MSACMNFVKGKVFKWLKANGHGGKSYLLIR